MEKAVIIKRTTSIIKAKACIFGTIIYKVNLTFVNSKFLFNFPIFPAILKP